MGAIRAQNRAPPCQSQSPRFYTVWNHSGIRLSRIVSTFMLGAPDDPDEVGPPSFRIASEISWDLS
jgi:hypothetical protein